MDIKNIHTSSKISATIEKTWIYKDEKHSEINSYTVEPKKKKYLGCSIPGPTNQKFERAVVDAKFAN